MNSIYVIGSSNTDMVVQCPHLPAPGETVLGGTFLRAQGGKGANQAVAAARLGGKVTFVCKVGNDSFGHESLEAYKAEGIDTSHVLIDSSGHSGVALIFVDEQGENSIAVASGVNLHLKPDDIEFLAGQLTQGDIVLLQLEIPLETVLRVTEIGKEKDATVILDPAPVPPQGLPEQLYRNLTYIVPNQQEAMSLLNKKGNPKELAQALCEKGVRHSIVTAGSEGVVLCADLGMYELPVRQVQAVDTTAAGDAFAGAMAAALAEEYKTREAIAYAQTAASISVTRMGAQPSLPTRDEVNRLVFDFSFEDPH